MATFTGTKTDEVITTKQISPTVNAIGGLRPSAAADTINAGGGSDMVSGGGGDDGVSLGAGSDTFIWKSGDGDDDVAGGSGQDTLRINSAGERERSTSAPPARRYASSNRTRR